MSANLTILASLLALLSVDAGTDRVKLKDINVLTLYANRMTTGRRSAPVPQTKARLPEQLLVGKSKDDISEIRYGRRAAYASARAEAI